MSSRFLSSLLPRALGAALALALSTSAGAAGFGGSWRTAPHRFYTKPSGHVRYTGKPVVLLTSDITVSAGELFTLHMRALPQVKQVGMSTQGAVSGGIPRSLPNGWQIGFPIEVTRDAQGHVHEVAGIPPSVAFDVFPAATFDTGRADAVHRAADIALGR